MKRVAMIILLLAAAITMRAEEPVKRTYNMGEDMIITNTYRNGNILTAFIDGEGPIATTLIIDNHKPHIGYIDILNAYTEEITNKYSFVITGRTVIESNDDFYSIILHTDMSHDIHVFTRYTGSRKVDINFIKK